MFGKNIFLENDTNTHVPYSRLKLSDFYSLSQTKLLETYTRYSGTCQ